ncbi:MAG: DUF362 domain-containing protein [Bacteroidetes bacterium]|nr:DUF362 domain-containing protein [Bacteroidota bacterium]
MKRREFLKTSSAAAVAAGSSFYFGNLSNLFPKNIIANASFDLVAVKGSEPDIMFDKAIESLGGIKNFVEKGQTVVVKPNIGWDTSAERAANTNPKLIKRIIEHCLHAGAKEIFVFDHTCDNWIKCYSNSGIEKTAKDAGAKVVSGASEGYYQGVQVKSGKNLKYAKVHELILSSDVFINVPVLKSHGGGRITAGMKNLMGIVWDRGYWHQNDLHQCIADFSTFKKPDLTIVDAYNVMMRNGPRGSSVKDLATMKSLIISKDIVAADAAAAKLFGINPDEVYYIKYADEMKIGTKDLSKLNINRIKM